MTLFTQDRSRNHPDTDVASAVFQQRCCGLGSGAACGHDIINQCDVFAIEMATRGKGMAEIALPRAGIKARLNGGMASPIQSKWPKLLAVQLIALGYQ